MSGVATAVGVGAGLSYLGSEQAASAAGKAAGAQGDAADRWQSYISGQQKDALGNLKTPAQMAAYEQTLQSQEREVSRQEELVKSINPALIEAGKQANNLLQGKDAPVLSNIKNQRGLQRQQMLDSLREQLGPGAETSSIGQQALARFDNDSTNMFSQAQQQYLGVTSNLALGGAAQSGQTMNSANSTLDSIMLNSPGKQYADAVAGFTGMGSQAQNAGVQAAGGQYAGAAIQGQNISSLGQNLVGLGGALAGARKSTKPTDPTVEPKPVEQQMLPTSNYSRSTPTGYDANNPAWMHS